MSKSSRLPTFELNVTASSFSQWSSLKYRQLTQSFDVSLAHLKIVIIQILAPCLLAKHQQCLQRFGNTSDEMFQELVRIELDPYFIVYSFGPMMLFVRRANHHVSPAI
ncbi:hypothetical protein ACH5RR_000839 [Cinchona calisaya]|uniref:Uncharacterized protein n=1 Tax=Cinchona calisaya TaxID=153742 RepID=A0ABD3B1V3_9GENT